MCEAIVVAFSENAVECNESYGYCGQATAEDLFDVECGGADQSNVDDAQGCTATVQNYLDCVSGTFDAMTGAASGGCSNAGNEDAFDAAEASAESSSACQATAGCNFDVGLTESGSSSGGGNCCSASDPCDWANDGFCDCNNDYGWDDVDCS